MKIKYLLNGILAALVFLAVFPILFTVAGSIMGSQELKQVLEPFLTGEGGYISWKFLPLYPTLRAYIEVLLDSPEFFVMFWNSVKITAGVLVGQILIGVPAAWGFAKYKFPGKMSCF